MAQPITTVNCTTLSSIDGTDCIGDSRDIINANIQKLGEAFCSLLANTIYVNNSPTINLVWNSTTRTLQANLVPSALIPTGAVSLFCSTFAPTGWLALQGQIVLRSQYPDLWTFAQNSGNITNSDTDWFTLSSYGSFSPGTVATEFRLPDLRGYFVRGSGTNTNGTAANTFGRSQIDALGSHNHTGSGTTNSAGAHTHPLDRVLSWPRAGRPAVTEQNQQGNPEDRNAYTLNTGSAGDHTHSVSLSINNTGGIETRPKNISLLYCIKT